MIWCHRIVILTSAALAASLLLADAALAIDLEYKVHAPPFSIGYDHLLIVDPAPGTFTEAAGDPAAVAAFNVWRIVPVPSKGKLEATSAIATDITAPGSGSVDEFHIVSPTAGSEYKLRGSILAPPPPGFYDGENSEFTAEGIGLGPAAAVPSIWDVEILSTGEPIGTPVRVDVRAIIQGYVEANMATHGTLPDARATWHVAAEGIPAISGMVSLIDGPGAIPFFDSNLMSPVTFIKAVGDTFTLEVFYKLEVDGEVLEAVSVSEVTGSEVIVTATVIPEPATVGLAVLTMLVAPFMIRRGRN
jgi:hypothetical protein